MDQQIRYPTRKGCPKWSFIAGTANHMATYARPAGRAVNRADCQTGIGFGKAGAVVMNSPVKLRCALRGWVFQECSLFILIILDLPNGLHPVLKACLRVCRLYYRPIILLEHAQG